MDNQQAEVLAEKVKKGDSKAFETLFDGTVNMVKVYEYFDPTGAMTQDDFLQASRIGLYEAINSWDPDRGSTLLSWVRMRMHQWLIKELKKVKRSTRLGNKVSIPNNEEEIFDDHNTLAYEVIQEHLSTNFPQDDFDIDLYDQIIQEVRHRLKNNRRILRVFEIKLADPEISRQELAKLLGISRTALSNYFDRIRTNINLVSKRITK